MIQRVQSIYLLLITILTFTMFYFPFIIGIGGKQDITVDSSIMAPFYPLSCLFILSMLLSFTSIFFYKNRKRQQQWNLINIVVFMLMYAFILFYFFSKKAELNISQYSFGIPFIIPAINIILTILAIVAIRKDDAKVKSLDRLR